MPAEQAREVLPSGMQMTSHVLAPKQNPPLQQFEQHELDEEQAFPSVLHAFTSPVTRRASSCSTERAGLMADSCSWMALLNAKRANTVTI